MALTDLDGRLTAAGGGRTNTPRATPRPGGAAQTPPVIGAIVVLWAAATAAFAAVHLAPGDTADVLIGSGPKTPAARSAINAEWHLHRPLLTQYFGYLKGAIHGDLGTSYTLHRPVSSVVFSQFGPTAELALSGAAVALVIAFLLAVTTAGRPWPSKIANGFELVLVSIPEFWLALVLLVVFSFKLGWFPVAGGSGLQSLVLPALALGLGVAGMLSQLLREGIARTLEEPYSLTVRSRGVRDLTLRLRHSLRHAAIPVATLTGYLIGLLLGGAVIVEQVFGRPGIGSITLAAVEGKDLPIVLGVALVDAFVYVVVSTLIDLVALIIDPRLRTPSRSS